MTSAGALRRSTWTPYGPEWHLEVAALESRLSLLWLTTHEDTEACAFYEAIGYPKLGVMPDYSRRPDGTLWPGAFYFKVLSA